MDDMGVSQNYGYPFGGPCNINMDEIGIIWGINMGDIGII